MSPSEKVRALLDERDIEWTICADGTIRFTDGKRWFHTWAYNDDLLCVSMGYLTPEQAIAATVGAEKRDTMELWPEWEQVLFANVSDEVAQDNLNECVHELLEKAATAGRSCASCPEADDPDSYISHLQAALKWHDEHVPRPTNPRGTCVVLQGKKPPEEVLFIRDGDGVTHYLPEETCHYDPDDAGFTWWDENDVEHHEEYSASDECYSASCDKCGMVCDEGWFDGWDEITEWTEEDGSEHKGYVLRPRFKHCPNCGRAVSE